METKKKNKSPQKMTFKERADQWLAQSPKLEKFAENISFYIKNPEKLNDKISEVYNKATNDTGNKTLGEIFGKVKTLGRMIKATSSGEYQELSKLKMIVGAGAIAYLILPFDLIPDFLPFFGFVDDFALLVWVIKQAAEEISKFEQWEGQHHMNVSPA